MHTHTSISLTFSAAEEKAQEVYAFFAEAASPDYDPFFQKQEDGYLICTDESYEITEDTELIDLAENIAKRMPEVSFELSGTIDASESCGEYMDYRITYRDRKLYVGFSDWYLNFGVCYVLGSGAGPEVEEVPLEEKVFDLSERL